MVNLWTLTKGKFTSPAVGVPLLAPYQPGAQQVVIAAGGNNHLATFTIMVYGSCCLEAGWVQIGTLGFAQVKVDLTHDLSCTQVNFPQEVNKYIL